MHRTAQGWIDAYRSRDAFWIHDGNPRRPHALLTSGKHSNGFFYSKPIIADRGLLSEAASDLIELLDQRGGDLGLVDCVVGPQTGATLLAELLGRELGCSWASPAKAGEGDDRSMIFSRNEIAQLPGNSVLPCEDVLTTGGSVMLAANAVNDAGGIVLPFILVLVNRSGLTEVDGKQIVSLIDRHMPIWEPDDCPLCRAGSSPISPKRPETNWSLLNKPYD
ncbi:MAG: hypothetical protein V4480_02280 [Patescibacteria group bacterium]